MIEMSWYVGIALPVLVRGDYVTKMSALNALKKNGGSFDCARAAVRVNTLLHPPVQEAFV